MNKILVVEDDKILQSNIADLLHSEGYKVLSANNGLEALNYFKEEIPDLIISDIMMPMMDGFELIKRTQLNPATSIIPFIFLTAKVDELDVRYGMNSGADDYLTKPFKAKELLDAVSTRLKKRENAARHFEEMKIEIASKVPHELRTPLVSIFGFSDLILDEINNLTQEEIIKYVTSIKQAGKRIYERVEKFLIYTEVELLIRGMLHGDRIKNETYLINQEEIEWNFRNRVEEMGRGKDFFISIEDCTLCIAKDYLMILINELLENAAKFSKPGTTIKFFGYNENEYYEIVVIDEGCGIKQEEIEQIKAFQQFERDDYKRDGIGLGLAIVKKILEIFNCKFIIENKMNKGTSVTIAIHTSL